MTTVVAVPDSVYIIPGAGGAAHSVVVGTNPLGDNDDSTYGEAWHTTASGGSTDTLVAEFNVPAGVGGASAADVVARLRVKVTDNGTSPSDSRLRVQMYATAGADPLFCQWQASLPDHTLIYDEGLPLDAHLTIGGDPDHWWEFENHTTGTITQADPWPEATTLLAAGNLTIDVIRANDTRTGTDWTEGQVTVYELTLTVPDDLPADDVGPMPVPPLRQHPRSDGLGTSSAPRVHPPAPSIQASNRQAGGYI